MRRMTEKERRGRDLIAREKVKGLPVLFLGYGLRTSFRLHGEATNDSDEPFPPMPTVAVQLGRKVIENSGTTRFIDVTTRSTPLWAASQSDLLRATAEQGGTHCFKAKVAEIIACRSLPTEAELTFDKIESGPRPNSFLIGRLSLDSTCDNLEWINPLREGLGMRPFQGKENLRAPIYYRHRLQPSPRNTLHEIVGVQLPLGPIVTSDTSLVPVYTR